MSIEFHTEVQGDAIQIPESVRKYLAVGKRVKVTISEEASAESTNYLRELIKNPVRIEGFRPMTRDEANER